MFTHQLMAWLAITGALVAVSFAGALAGIEYFRDVFRAADKLGAALGGKSGRYTVSAECGASTTRFGAAGRVVIDGLLGKGHCVDAAHREGLL